MHASATEDAVLRSHAALVVATQAIPRVQLYALRRELDRALPREAGQDGIQGLLLGDARLEGFLAAEAGCQLQGLAAVALRAADPSLAVLRLDRSLWQAGAPRSDLPRPVGSAAMLCQGQTCSLPVTTPEALGALLEERAAARP